MRVIPSLFSDSEIITNGDFAGVIALGDTARVIDIKNSKIQSDGENAGSVFVDASDTISISDSNVTTNGNSGMILIGNSITTSQVTISGQRTTNTDNSSGFNYTTNITTTNLDRDNGLAGDIQIYARDEINISGSRLDSTTDIANLRQ